MRASRSLAALAVIAGFAAAPRPAAAADQVVKTTWMLPNQKVVQVRLAKESSSHLARAEVEAALHHAVEAWNAVLPADMRLRETSYGDPMPKGEIVVLCRFDGDARHFKGAGIEEFAFTSTLLAVDRNEAVTYVAFNDSDAFHASAGFSTTGAPTSYDFEIVVLHELGHALGMNHDASEDAIPPLMAPRLEPNARLLARTGATLDALRRPQSIDAEHAAYASRQRKKELDLSGTYEGTLKVTDAGGGAVEVGHSFAIGAADFVVTQDADRIVLTYRGSTAKAPAVGLLAPSLRFSEFQVGGAVVSAMLTRGDPENVIHVTLEMKPGRATYTVKGDLTKK
jgi:hypothetical protein